MLNNNYIFKILSSMVYISIYIKVKVDWIFIFKLFNIYDLFCFYRILIFSSCFGSNIYIINFFVSN